MKVYISVDSEGQACVVREKDPERAYGPWQAEYIRRRATAETAAAIEGAREAGATDITVHDSGFIRGVTPVGLVLHYDDLPRGIHIALGGIHVKRVVDSGFDAAFLLGYHAMAGSVDAVMPHTFSSVSVKDMTLNGRPIGELGIISLQIGSHGVPVVLVSADEAGCREAVDWLGDVEVAPTKQGFGVHQAISLHPADAEELIRSKARRALQRLGDFKPFTMEGPFELRVNCNTEEQARAGAEKMRGRFTPPASYIVRTDNPLDLTP